MAQAQQKGFAGFGIVYPGGGNVGLKVVKTFTQGATRTVQPDGSVTYSTPPPTIHELFGGGFAYADGSLVKDRAHLEIITDPEMKKRALAWFDGQGVGITAEDIVERKDEEKPERPEPAFLTSNQLIKDGDFVETERRSTISPQRPTDESVSAMSLLAKGMSDVLGKLDNINGRLTALETAPKPKRRPTDMESNRVKKMRARWADPEYRQKRLEAMQKGREAKGQNEVEQ